MEFPYCCQTYFEILLAFSHQWAAGRALPERREISRGALVLGHQRHPSARGHGESPLYSAVA